jgi:hypothetical protein
MTLNGEVVYDLPLEVYSWKVSNILLDIISRQEIIIKKEKTFTTLTYRERFIQTTNLA